MQVIVDIPDELAERLDSMKNRLPQILELGLRELDAANQIGYVGAAEVLEFLAALPTPEEIIALRPSDILQSQVRVLLAKNRNEGLTPEEEHLWEQYQYLEHLVRIAKAKAFLKLKAS